MPRPPIRRINEWLKIHRERSQAPLSPHQHPWTELVIVISGNGQHIMGGGEVRIMAGDVFAVCPGERHGFGDTHRLELVNIIFDWDKLGLPIDDLSLLPGYHLLFTVSPFMEGQSRKPECIQLPGETLTAVNDLVKRIEQEFDEEIPGSRFAMYGYIVQIIAQICRAPLTAPSKNTRLAQRLADVLGFLQDNWRNPITVEEIAGKANMSRSTLFRTFRSVLGCSPIDHLRRIRLNHARELLLHSDMPISDIAEEVAIPDQSYFARAFKKEYSVTPRQYRSHGK